MLDLDPYQMNTDQVEASEVKLLMNRLRHDHSVRELHPALGEVLQPGWRGEGVAGGGGVLLQRPGDQAGGGGAKHRLGGSPAFTPGWPL
jgi:hypothetical protein